MLEAKDEVSLSFSVGHKLGKPCHSPNRNGGQLFPVNATQDWECVLKTGHRPCSLMQADPTEQEKDLPQVDSRPETAAHLLLLASEPGAAGLDHPSPSRERTLKWGKEVGGSRKNRRGHWCRLRVCRKGKAAHMVFTMVKKSAPRMETPGLPGWPGCWVLREKLKGPPGELVTDLGLRLGTVSAGGSRGWWLPMTPVLLLPDQRLVSLYSPGNQTRLDTSTWGALEQQQALISSPGLFPAWVFLQGQKDMAWFWLVFFSRAC
jgi:hypothetical protein